MWRRFITGKWRNFTKTLWLVTKILFKFLGHINYYNFEFSEGTIHKHLVKVWEEFSSSVCLCCTHDKYISSYFAADSSVTGVEYLAVWRKFLHQFCKGRDFMVCYSKMREQIRIFVLQPVHYFLNVKFSLEWMDKCGLSFCHLMPFNLQLLISSYGFKKCRSLL